MTTIAGYNKKTGQSYRTLIPEKDGTRYIAILPNGLKMKVLADKIEFLQEQPVKAVKVVDKPLVPPSVLTTPAQIDLYKLIVAKLETNDKVTLEEAKSIWLNKVKRRWNKDKKDGWPLKDESVPRYNVYGQFSHYTYERRRMTEDEITFTVLDWLTKNIGVMVIRGALEIIPMIDVKQLKAKE